MVTVDGSITYRAVLLEKENPETVSAVVAALPFQSFLLHPNVSGEGMVIPTSIVFLGKSNMTARGPGSMYFYGPGQSIVCTYGETKESAPVNAFAKVWAEDRAKLKKAGELVYRKTFAQAPFEEVTVTVSLDDGSKSIRRALDDSEKPAASHEPSFRGNWREATTVFEWHAGCIIKQTPDDIVKVYAGIIDGGMGTGEQYFTVIMHIWSYLMTDGPNILYRFLTDIQDDEMTPGLLIRQTRRHLLQPFNHPEFLADLGLTQFGKLGPMYDNALNTIDTIDREKGLEQYRNLTGAYMTVVNLMHRRVQQRFPFHLGKAFPHRRPEEIYAIMALLLQEICNGERELPSNFPKQEVLNFAAYLDDAEMN